MKNIIMKAYFHYINKFFKDYHINILVYISYLIIKKYLNSIVPSNNLAKMIKK